MPSINATVAIVAAVVLVILLVNSVARGDSSAPPDLTGSITRINRTEADPSGTGHVGALLITGVLADGSPVEVLVRVSEKSRLARKTSQGLQEASFDELAEGQKVEVKFEGPVLMSYPLQAQGATITILSL